MPVTWGAALRAYWPFVLLAAVNVVGGIYTVGYAKGQRSILRAAEEAHALAVGDNA